MIIRYVKMVLLLNIAAFALLVAANNVLDYGANFAFVQHVLSMDTLFPDNQALGRAITTPWLWHAAYWLIIAAEFSCGLLVAYGAVALWRARLGTAREFNQAKSCATLGLCGGFLLWFFGFMVVGGEWFLMWQSATWNGQQAAFRFYMAILGVLVFVSQADAELS